MDISDPTLLLNERICKANIRRMADKAAEHELIFKPHMKTHQSAEIGRWIREAGAHAITVSSVTMAQYFADHGWDDITIAFPCNILKLDEINELADAVSLTLLVNNVETVHSLANGLTHEVNVYIEIDTGSHRTGLTVDQISDIKELINEINEASTLKWIGFYSHPGHSYSSRSKEQIKQIHHSTIRQFKQLRSQLESELGTFEVCIGDTPCCTVADNFEGIDAISPGNFVFYDVMQYQIGCCQISDIAVAVACPVVDKYPDRNELAIHGGAIHFSKETLDKNGRPDYGRIASTAHDHWTIQDESAYVKALSQEHGIIKCSKELFDQYNIGDLITVLPVHSCLTANLMKSYQLLDKQRISML